MTETLREKLIRCGWASNFSVDTLVRLIEDHGSTKPDNSTPEGFLHFQARIILNELHAARQLATRLGHDPAEVTPPYLEHMQRLYLP